MMENILVNKDLLIQYKLDLESRKLWKSVKDLDKSDKTSELYCMTLTATNIEKCFKMLELGLSITDQLEDIRIDTENYWYNEECDKTSIEVPITDLIELFKQFKFRDYQEELEHFIKQNIDWRKKNRDFEIYNEIRDGTLYSEIAEKLDVTIPAISMINKKVQSSINNLKGKFFEIRYEKYLKSLDNFKNCKVVRDGAPGKPDIYIMNKKRELFVFSIKNLELNKKSFAIVKEQLKPELQFAYYNNTFEEINKVVLYLIVFDSLTERIHVKEINFNKPSNINIHR